MVSTSEKSSLKNPENSSSQKQPSSVRRNSLRLLSQTILEKLSTSHSSGDHMDSDFLTSEIRRRLTQKSKGPRRLSILSQSGSYRLDPSSRSVLRSKSHTTVEQVSLSRINLRPFPGGGEKESPQRCFDTAVTSVKGKASEGQPSMNKSSRTRTRKQTSNGKTASTSSRNSRVSVVRKTSSKNERSRVVVSGRKSQRKKQNQVRTVRESSKKNSSSSVKGTPISLGLNTAALKKVFRSKASSTKGRQKDNKNKSSSKKAEEDYFGSEDYGRRMSFDEYQLLEHKKKLEKDLVFKTYRERRAEFIHANETVND